MMIKCKHILLTIMLVALGSLFAFTEAQPPSNYSELAAGTSVNPYLISNLANLRWLSETPEAWGSAERRLYYLQTTDIDATETKDWNDGKGFIPIAMIIVGTVDRFYGNYNGNNHIIKNIYINREQGDADFKSIGFFSMTDSATISNIRLENIRIHSDYRTGGLIGTAMNSTIENCNISGIITVGKSAAQVGSLVGTSLNSKIRYSFSTATIDGEDSASGDSGGSLGGLIGSMNNSLLSNSFFNGKIERIVLFSGGLVGAVTHNSVIENSYVTTNASLHQRTFEWDTSELHKSTLNILPQSL